jgi:MOSC domain-containing protein YiiM
MHIGTVLALAVRPDRAALPLRTTTAEARAGIGLLNDIHADALSPRQLLLAGADTYAEFALAPHTLRENLLLDIDTAALRSGTVLQIGGDVRLRLMFQCEACGQLDVYRQGLASALGQQRGILARVLNGGTIRIGDPVRDLGPSRPAWSDDWRLRVQRVLDAVPPDHVIDYAQLARLAGVQSTYCRAFPRMLAKLGPTYARKAVSRQASPELPRWQGNGLFDHESDERTERVHPSAIS